jgi:hypothetical protein
MTTAVSEEMVERAQFLIDRLDEWERDLGETTDVETDYIGHVHPAKERLRAALSAALPLPVEGVDEPLAYVEDDDGTKHVYWRGDDTYEHIRKFPGVHKFGGKSGLTALYSLATPAAGPSAVAVTEQMVEQLLGDLALAFALNDVLVGYAECEKLARNMLANIVAIQNRALSTLAPSEAVETLHSESVERFGKVYAALASPSAEAAPGDPICRKCADQEHGDTVPEECTCGRYSTEAAKPVADILANFHQNACYPQALDFELSAAVSAIFAALSQPQGELREALVRAERKLAAYVGVCKGDKELTDTVLPMVRAALAGRTAG